MRNGEEASKVASPSSPVPAGKLYTYHPPSDSSQDSTSTADSTSQHLLNLPPKTRLPISERSFLSRFERRDELAAGQADSFGTEAANEDSAAAVDDDVWRQFDVAQEYYQMGVLANREAGWEEAQYYFEKALKILAGLDIEQDSTETPEQVKYSTLLENIVADYKMTLRSLGRLDEDVTPTALVERFADLESQLEHDTLKVFKGETKAPKYDLPVSMNERVRSSMIYFQTQARDAFARYLSRIRRYEWLYNQTIDKYGLPRDLIYLSLVESGFNTNAYSWARAMGLWQFIASTGRLYGLQRNWWVDERKDPIKATDAACRMLRDLYQQFGDWELAMAAYNGGPGRIQRTTARQGTRDFWKLQLKRQTMDYVPLIYAAAIIAKDPAKYGFGDVIYEPAVQWDTLTVTKSLDLRAVAEVVGCSLEDIKSLNPELLRNSTPPRVKNYLLKVPKGKSEVLMASLESMSSPKESNLVHHSIRRGETVGTIASKYGVSQYAILEANNMSRGTQIIAGKELIVPVPLDRYLDAPPVDRRQYATNNVYEIRSGDNLWDIARSFGTTVDAIRRINYLERGSRIYVGQKLRIPTESSSRRRGRPDQPSIGAPKPPIASIDRPSGRVKGSPSASSDATRVTGQKSPEKYTVRAGDTIWDIARIYNTTSVSIRQLNKLGRSGRIYPGQELLIQRGDTTGFVVHLVQDGETMGNIAQRYRTTVARILVSNGLSDPNSIKVGDNLKIYPE
ncbi:MAG: LysM peptidoglycan-binding domain-containing protein [candidate division Zixibacteria bacterium]|nr:LysM peptidoglycan-binding domain-containing protein [candidate division Zixibacteria bacterium]